jgi:hypothetical protein
VGNLDLYHQAMRARKAAHMKTDIEVQNFDIRKGSLAVQTA